MSDPTAVNQPVGVFGGTKSDHMFLTAALLRGASLAPTSLRGVRRLLVSGVGLAVTTNCASAAETAGHIPGYKHTAFTLSRGAPGLVYDFAQTKDGYLWIASYYGLWRYDGVQFERVTIPDTLPRRSGFVFTLFADRDGNLWIGHDWGGTTLYRDGKFRDMNLTPYGSTPVRRVEDPAGRVWSLSVGAAGVRLQRCDRGHCRELAGALGLKGLFPIEMLLARDGTIWLALEDGGVAYLPRNARRFQVVRPRDAKAGGFFSFSLREAGDGSIWRSSRLGLSRIWDGIAGHQPQITASDRRFQSSIDRVASATDKSGFSWISANGTGLYRARLSREASSLSRRDMLDGKTLTSPVINTVFSDRENNIWIGTNLGIDRLRPVEITKALSLKGDLRNYEIYGPGVSHGANGFVVIKSGSTIYSVADDGGLARISGASPTSAALCIDARNSLWSWSDKELVQSNGPGRIPLPSTKRPMVVPSCAISRDGWWITSTDGLYRRTGNGWQRHTLDPRRGLDGAQIIALDSQGSLLAYYGNGNTYRVTQGRVETIWKQDGPLRFINFMERVGNSVLIGGTYGLARYGPHAIEVLPRHRYPELDEVSGIAVGSAGDTWLAVRQGLISVSTKSLLYAFDHPGAPLRFEKYGPKDGLDAYSFGAFRNNLALDRAGRLWMSTVDGVFVLNPSQRRKNDLAPPVIIKSITANGRTHVPGAVTTLEKGTSTLQLDFTAPSLGDPEGVRFRYRLWGHDGAWIDAGAQRRAIYTNLAPGSYRFQVLASNEDGVWNKVGATAEIQVPPTFLQSTLFKILCWAAVAIIAAALYRARLGQIAARIKARHEARTSERERIARELHDTLLQGVQGLIIGLQNVVDDLPEEDAARKQMNQALDQADGLLEESRDRVRDLRQSAIAADISSALLPLAQRALAGAKIEVRHSIEGDARDLHPAVAEEIVRIAEEALFNIYRHAGATQVGIGLSFGKRHLAMHIEDNGIGFAETDKSERGRFGLQGMGERATRIGGTLEISSRPGGGTIVSVVVPARSAYAPQRHARSHRSRNLRRWLHRSSDVPPTHEPRS